MRRNRKENKRRRKNRKEGAEGIEGEWRRGGEGRGGGREREGKREDDCAGAMAFAKGCSPSAVTPQGWSWGEGIH